MSTSTPHEIRHLMAASLTPTSRRNRGSRGFTRYVREYWFLANNGAGYCWPESLLISAPSILELSCAENENLACALHFIFYHANNQYLPIGVFKPAGLLFKILAWRGSEGGIANAKLAWFCIAAFGYVMKLCKVRKSMQSIFAPRDPWVLKRLTFKTEYMYNHYLLVTGRHLTIGVVLLIT